MEIALALMMFISLYTAPPKPSRIVSTTLATDEIAAALVDPARIVAMSPFASDPVTSNVAETARKVNRFAERNAEQIVALNPDLVLSTRYSKIDLKELLLRAGIPYQELSQFQDVSDVETNVRTIAKRLGEEARGEDVIRAMKAKLDMAGRQLQPERRAWRVLYLAAGDWTAGARTTFHEILIHTGMKNAAAEAGITGNNKISIEKVIKTNPDVIVIGTGYPRDADYLRQLTTDPRLASLKAVTLRRIIPVPSRYLLTTSQFIGDAAVEVGRLVQALPR